MTAPQEILEFWHAKGAGIWWSKDVETDRQIAEKFSHAHEQARLGKLAKWQDAPEPALALVILLDQFSRNLFRGDAKSFAQDAAALEIAENAIARKFDNAVDPELRSFFYLPFMHSEKIHDQRRCVALMHMIDEANSLKFAIIHRDIIARFGRFPHRNNVLGRHTTIDEQKFLDEGGFGG